MTTPEKIEEWIKEAEERPSSAVMILRIIANRLGDLTQRNEELLDENIALRSEKKIEEYEMKLANLEYQLELLKRQLGGQALVEPTAVKEVDTRQSLILFTPQGYLLRTEFEPGTLEPGGLLASMDLNELPEPPRFIVTGPQEELLLAFSSGRSLTMPVSEIEPVAPGMITWEGAYYQEPVGMEELVFVQPVARMALSEMCVTASRRGFTKKARESFFEGYIGKNYIGTGVKLPLDKAFNLTFCQGDDLFVISSREGYLATLPVALLPQSIEETIKLNSGDYVVSAYCLGNKISILVVTNTGKAVVRETSWLEAGEKLPARGQALLSKERRESGVRIAGSAAVTDADWGVAMTASGRLMTYRTADLAAAGTLKTGEDEVIEFVVFGGV